MISVIIVNHNYKNYIDQCIKSVIKNKSKLIKEIIIIDDSSSDNSRIHILKKYSKLKKIIFYKVDFGNLSKTLNFAINRARGKWIFKIDADDFINKNFILEFTKYMEDFDFIFGDLIVFDQHKKIKIKQKFKNNFLKYFYYPLGSGNLYKKNLWKKIGGYNERYYYKDDVYFWSNINNINDVKIKYINKSCYYYRKHNNSMSKNILRKYITLFKIIIFN